MEAFADVWHSAGQAVIMNDHSNRLDMMEFVDGIYAEMGDMDASGKPHRCCWHVRGTAQNPGIVLAGGSGLGSLNSHAVGTALASLGPTAAYIWNHPKTEAKMTEAYVSAGLMTHLYAGVFPTVPIKNNDHCIGGDCAPNCSYDDTFAACASTARFPVCVHALSQVF